VIGVRSVVCFLACAVSACQGSYFLAQATHGHFDLMGRAVPVHRLRAQGRLPKELDELLAQIPRIKKFGAEQGLNVSGNYNDYAELDRDAAVWVVTASEPLAFKGKVWSFPLVGSFPYLGWYSESDANTYARTLETEGLDVHVRQAAAYSTLGWFSDPLLSTMISRSPDRYAYLVNTVLHEAVHATIHIPHQSYFNESLATFVGDGMTEALLTTTLGAQSALLRYHLDARSRGKTRSARLAQLYDELAELYDSGESDEHKLVRKAELIAAAEAELGLAGINNARLIGYRTYGVGRQEFAKVYEACEGSWRRFLGRLGSLKFEDFGKPQQEDLGDVLLPLADPGC